MSGNAAIPRHLQETTPVDAKKFSSSLSIHEGFDIITVRRRRRPYTKVSFRGLAARFRIRFSSRNLFSLHRLHYFLVFSLSQTKEKQLTVHIV